MASCMLCKKDVTTGFVVCGNCAHSLKPFTLPVELAYFIDQLAEDLVRNENSCSCDMCSIDGCLPQISGLTCKNGIKAWLLTRAGQYFSQSTAPTANTCSDALSAREARINGFVGHNVDEVIAEMEHISAKWEMK